MRILVTTNAAVGHFLPMAPTVAALIAAGHDVRVGCPEGFASFVERCGFPTIGCREVRVEPEVPPMPPPTDHQERLTWAIVHSWPADCRSWVDELVSAAHNWRPDAVMVEPVEHAGRIVAAAIGVPLVVHGWGFTLPSGTDEAAADGLADLYRQVGAEPFSPTLVADLGPGRLQPPDAPRVRRFAYVPWPLPGEAIPGRSAQQRVLMTLGTYPNPRAASCLREAALAAHRLGVEVVLVLGNRDRESTVELPPDVITVRWTDMRSAIRSSDLVLHHGGAGTTWTTLAEGRPAVVLPQGGDQFANADRLAAAGAGLVVDEAAQVGDAIESALDDTALAQNAAQVASENAAMDAPAVLAEELAAFVRSA
jgi:UDP:flavonoid glycosyltransferase YjiC (YdhE family)